MASSWYSFFVYLISLGLLGTVALGLVGSFVYRKVAALLQWRIGPPFFQPLIDIIKLLSKETIVPSGASALVFFGAPVLSFAGVALASTILWFANIHPGKPVLGDIIVVIYLLTLPAICGILGACTSRNPLATVGSSREASLVVAYELPFIIAVLSVVSRGRSILLGDLVLSQGEQGIALASFSGALAFIVVLLCTQAKLTLVPFDVPEAETEIMGGAYIEYCGPILALYKLTRSMLLFVLPFLMITLFWGGGRFDTVLNSLVFLGKYIAILALIILIKNVNPRVRMDQAVRFFWGPVTIVSLISLAFATGGW